MIKGEVEKKISCTFRLKESLWEKFKDFAEDKETTRTQIMEDWMQNAVAKNKL